MLRKVPSDGWREGPNVWGAEGNPNARGRGGQGKSRARQRWLRWRRYIGGRGYAQRARDGKMAEAASSHGRRGVWEAEPAMIDEVGSGHKCCQIWEDPTIGRVDGGRRRVVGNQRGG